MELNLALKSSVASSLCAHLINKRKPGALNVRYGKETCIDLGNGLKLVRDGEVCRYLARLHPDMNLLGRDPVENAQTESWIALSQDLAVNGHSPDSVLTLLETTLGLSGSGYLLGCGLTVADIVVFAMLSASDACRKALSSGSYDKVTAFCSSMFGLFSADLHKMLSLTQVQPSDAKSSKKPSKREGEPKAKKPKSTETEPKAKQRDEGKFVDLPGAEMGKVVVRFPPEASGYLHIGHAKAALLNQHYQHSFKGKLILRFDDTNPAKETEEFEQVIIQDVAMLSIKPDLVSRTSDHFDTILAACERLITDAKAYVDDTDPDTMKAEREARTESKCRSQDVATNLALWAEMRKGSKRGQQCGVRMRIDMQADNGCMRDPILYRCKLEPHLKTGTKYKCVLCLL